MAVARCGDHAWVASERSDGIQISRIRFAKDGNPVERTYVYPDQGARPQGLDCDANELRVLSVNGGRLSVLSFPFSGSDLQTPLSPTNNVIPVPSVCSGIDEVKPSYTGGLHFGMRCRASDNSLHLLVGSMSGAQEFLAGSDNKAMEVGAYAFSGGIHVLFNGLGEGHYGATPADLQNVRKLSFEDPVSRPTALAQIGSGSTGFTVFGVTTNPPPSLLPGKVFTGVIPPSQVSGIFVGGTLPASVLERRTLTTATELGPPSPLAIGMNSTTFSNVNSEGAMRYTVMDSTGEILLWTEQVYAPPSGSQARRAYATHDDFTGNMAIWPEFDANGVYSIKGINLLCI